MDQQRAGAGALVRSLTITSRRGFHLAARLHGSYKTSPVLIIAHGMLSSKSSPRHILLANEALARGMAVLRFDFAGRGNSEGSWHDLTPQGELQDLLGVIDFLKKRTSRPLALYGSSLGGWAALRAAGLAPVAAVATWAAVADFHQLRLFDNKNLLNLWKNQGVIDFQGSRLPYKFYQEAQAEGPDWAQPACPVYLAHGTADEIVPLASARELAGRLPDCYFRELPQADHRLLDLPRRAALIRDMADWLAERVKQC